MKTRLFLATLILMLTMNACGNGDSKTALFNGENLEGWTCVLDEKADVPTSEVYGVKDGNIHIAGNVDVSVFHSINFACRDIGFLIQYASPSFQVLTVEKRCF